jgi:hypothetical protein
LNDPEIVALLKKHFVAFALNNAGWTRNMTPAEALWLKDRGGRFCTQGMAVVTAGGEVLQTGGGYQAAPNIKMLKDALSKYKPEEKVEIGDPAAAVDSKEPDLERLPRVVSRPAKDGLVLYVTWKALGSPEKPNPADDQLSGKELLVDRVWAGKAEADALAAGNLSEKLKQRIAVHVGSVMDSKVKAVDWTLREQRLSGSFLLENGERCAALAFVAVKDGKVSRFDMIVKGMIVGTGRESNGGFPSISLLPVGKKRPAALAFMLADPNEELAKVQPGSGKDLGGGEEKQPLK